MDIQFQMERRWSLIILSLPVSNPHFDFLVPFWCRGAPYFQMIETKLQYYINPYCQLGSPAYASEFIIAIKNFFDRRSHETCLSTRLALGHIN